MVVLSITDIEVDYFEAMKVMLEAHSCGMESHMMVRILFVLPVYCTSQRVWRFLLKPPESPLLLL